MGLGGAEEIMTCKWLFIFALVNTGLKVLMQIIIGQSVQKFPHFETPLSSLSSVKEAIHSSKIHNTFY